MRFRVEHTLLRENLGLIRGSGTVKVNGKNRVINFSGMVTGHGSTRGSAAGSFFPPTSGTAILSADGLALAIHARGQSITLRKDRCGNRPPVASIVSLANGAVLALGRTYWFRGEVTDPDDSVFPLQRKLFTSNRDGVLGGTISNLPKGLAIRTSGLSAGVHTVTFKATDSGGLTATRSITVTVKSDKPEPPIISQPDSSDALVASGDIIFEGKSWDPEDGNLTGTSLVWRLKPAAGDTEDSLERLQLVWTVRPLNPEGSPVVFQTTGTEASHIFTTGRRQGTLYEVSFSAKDSGGLTATSRLRVYVRAFPIRPVPRR